MMSIQLSIHPALESEQAILANLIQMYFYDFSEYNDDDLIADGTYGPYPELEQYWKDSVKFPYLIRVNEQLAGFALVEYMEKEEQGTYFLHEFFVVKKYRRTGVGKQAAQWLFDEHRGNWEMYQLVRNTPAQLFWNKVIGEYTNNTYTEEVKHRRRFQYFNTCKA
ncbi:GNAT family N-acetyltransferase [Paenibacillus sp. 481]|uniref:GNAT family N-acetyltransferase n=1 Tax=Paenibacillus sp. 481 TaxID=2835869 RepID=UPI001E477311|nr:GNAT family N-acetyltransferase [Paenibacillus sp. 481]UHA72748.1 GNAT family N-acetyltransferase [Paenibacillus sp. 481]